MKKKDLFEGYVVARGAKLTKLADAGKYKVIKACKAMRSVAEEIEALKKEAEKRLAGEEHEEMDEKAKRWRVEGVETTLTIEERIAVNNYFAAYNKRVVECLNEEHNAEVALEYERLTDEEMKQLIASNDWTAGEIVAVMEVLE